MQDASSTAYNVRATRAICFMIHSLAQKSRTLLDGSDRFGPDFECLTHIVEAAQQILTDGEDHQWANGPLKLPDLQQPLNGAR